MLQRVVASFIVRVIHEPDNEQIPWNITVQHLQSSRVYRLADLKGMEALLAEEVNKQFQVKSCKVIPLEIEDSKQGGG